MAKATSSGSAAARNPHSPAIDSLMPAGARPVHHPLLTPSVQVQILSVVDATGSASIGDIIAELRGMRIPSGRSLP